MTSRSLLIAFGAGLFILASAGCADSTTGVSDADLDALATGEPDDLLAYNAGFEFAGQSLEQDSSFNFDRFREGFAAGMRGDSAELAYVAGLRAGFGLKSDTTSTINPDVFLAGLSDRVAGRANRVTPEQVAQAETVYRDSSFARQNRAAEVGAMADLRTRATVDPAAKARLDAIGPNLAASQRFLGDVAGRPGVQKTASGLLYTTQTAGTGPSPTEADQVEIRYVGKLADGTVFDQSPAGQTATLPVQAVVPGFSEALKLMKEGGTRTFFIPPSLAYGQLGIQDPGDPAGGIPPNSALEFEITLVEVLPSPPQGFGQMQGAPR